MPGKNEVHEEDGVTLHVHESTNIENQMWYTGYKRMLLLAVSACTFVIKFPSEQSKCWNQTSPQRSESNMDESSETDAIVNWWHMTNGQ
jgi:hypothetical protein